MTSSYRIVCFSLALCLGVSSLRADGLKSAQVSRIFNEVKLLPENQAPRAAAVADTISGKAAVQTGAASRTELVFTDKTLTRLGANSFFSFVNGTRDMNLGSGTMLLQVPKGAGGAEIHTAAVTAAITGTTLMVEFNPKSYSKIVVLEGTVRVFLTKRIGESVLVHAGQMVIVPPGAASMPEPVSVDLKVLYATSGLINDFGKLASVGLIDREITKQRKDIGDGRLVDTNLFIVGRGTQVQEGHLSFISGEDHNITARQTERFPVALGESTVRQPPPPTPVPEPTATPSPTRSPFPTPTVTPTATPTASPTATPTATPTASPSATPSATPSPTAVPTATPPPSPTATPTATPTPTVTPTPTPTPSPTASPSPTPRSTKRGPLPLIANNAGGNSTGGAATAYAIDPTTTIRTDPFITTQGVTDEGRIYEGGTASNPSGVNSPDGLPSFYFLGAKVGPSAFDTQIGFDTQFGTLGDVGGFKFSNLVLLGNPESISTVDGPTSLIFVAVNGISDSLPGNAESERGQPNAAPVQTVNTFDLRGLDHVAFVTQNGPIAFNNGPNFVNTGTAPTSLTFYARGGQLTTGSGVVFNLPGSVLNFFSDTGVDLQGRVGPDEAAGAGAVNIISGGDLFVRSLLHTTGDVTATTVAGGGDLNLVFGGSIFTEIGSFIATSGAAINIDGGIDTAANTRLTAANGVNIYNNITAGGDVRLVATGGDVFTDSETLIQSGGVFTARATAGNVFLNGTVGATEDNFMAGTPTTAIVSAGLDVTLNGDLAVTDGASIASTGGSVTQSGGVIRSLGETPGGTPTPGAVTVTTANGDVNLNAGSLSGNSVTITTTGGNITKASDHSLFANRGDLTLTSTSGVISLAGDVNSAGAILARAGGGVQLQGAALVSGLDANVTLSSTGGNVIIDEDSSVDMNGGTFTATTGGALAVAGRVGRLAFGRPGGTNAAVTNEPDYATATAGNGITVSGSIATGGSDGGQPADEDGIELTATGGDLSVSGTLETFGGGILLKADQGALTTSGFIYSATGVELTSRGDLTVNGTVQGTGGSVEATSNQGALNIGSSGIVTASGDLSLSSSTSMGIAGSVTAGDVASLTTFGPITVTVSGSVSAGDHFSATSFGDALTVEGPVLSRGAGTSVSPNPSTTGSGSFFAQGPFGTVSSLSAPDRNNGALSIGGTVDVGAGEIDFTAGTTFSNDPFSSSITATHVEITAGTTATINFSRFHYGGNYDPGLMNVHAQTIIGTTDTSGYNTFQEISPLNLYATGPITLSGRLSVETLQGGNLTLLPSSLLYVRNLNTTGPTGALVIGNSYFQLQSGTNANAVGPITLDGSPTVELNASLAVAGGISTTAANQGPSVTLFSPAALNVTGSIALGAGSVVGYPGTTVATNSTLTTTGDVTASTLHTYGGFSIGTLSAGTITLQDVGGNLPADPPASTVNGAVTPYTLNAGTLNTFTLGRFTSGALQFGGGYRLTLTITGNYGIGAGNVAGYSASADFRGTSLTPNISGQTAGAGGVFTVTALPNTFNGTLGNLRVQDNGTGVVPIITSMGGNLTPVNNSISGVGGAGGALVLNSAGLLSVGSGATLTAAGGSFVDTQSTTYFGGAANDGGAGGTVTLNAGGALALNGLTGTAGTTAGPLTISAQGGDSIYSNSGTGGVGGTVNLTGVDGVSLANTTVNAGGGSNRQGTLSGDPRGGTINVLSSGAASAVTTVSITNSTLFASNGVAGTQARGTGGTINILSNDATVAPAPSPTPVPAVIIDNSRLTASQEPPAGTPGDASFVGGTINVTSQRTGGSGIVVRNSSQLLALTSRTSATAGGQIALTTRGADISVAGPTPVASPSPAPSPTIIRASGPNSSVTLNTGTTGGTISVNNATVSTADATGALTTGGTVSLTTGSNAATGTSTINVTNGSVLRANQLNLTALGANAFVNVGGTGGTLPDATSLNADMLKIRAFGTNGAVVINGGSVLSAATQLKLYADGSAGSITFTGGNITLNTGSLAGIVAAPTITIRTGTTVTVNGTQTLQVYATTANYTGSGGNGSQGGTFNGPRAPTTVQPFNTAPTYSAAAPATPARATGPAATQTVDTPRLLRQGKVMLLVKPVRQTDAARQQNRAVLQNLAGVTLPTGRAMPADRLSRQKVQRDRTTTEGAPKVVRPVAAPTGAGLQR